MTINDWNAISSFGWGLHMIIKIMLESCTRVKKFTSHSQACERTKKRHEMKCDDFNRMHLDFYWPVDVIICAKWLWIQWKALVDSKTVLTAPSLVMTCYYCKLLHLWTFCYVKWVACSGRSVVWFMTLNCRSKTIFFINFNNRICKKIYYQWQNKSSTDGRLHNQLIIAQQFQALTLN